MLKENNPLLKLKLKKEEPIIIDVINSIFESIYALYDFILLDPLENFWFECFSIILSYCQLGLFIFDKIVRINIFIIYIIV